MSDQNLAALVETGNIGLTPDCLLTGVECAVGGVIHCIDLIKLIRGGVNDSIRQENQSGFTQENQSGELNGNGYIRKVPGMAAPVLFGIGSVAGGVCFSFMCGGGGAK